MKRIFPLCLLTDLVIPNLFVGTFVIDDRVLYKMILLYSFVCFLSAILTLFPFLLSYISTASTYVTNVKKILQEMLMYHSGSELLILGS